MIPKRVLGPQVTKNQEGSSTGYSAAYDGISGSPSPLNPECLRSPQLSKP